MDEGERGTSSWCADKNIQKIFNQKIFFETIE